MWQEYEIGSKLWTINVAKCKVSVWKTYLLLQPPFPKSNSLAHMPVTIHANIPNTTVAFNESYQKVKIIVLDYNSMCIIY